ncbi:glycoside hydrolase family 55 protein [Dacryopinax primogenitus]|uniref:Glycoside hydrolase family 55 protein n=1 Tax=Dacryopinax primogenitus (strain DJM 731) TaxID=1858805 RepID=M5FVL9_DACPD|nr:glycoside hydrolase family 55 protein [Dacryopinax primogenitus]EJU01871.1 glycoside hydrolase family 55 protein [Dacryopinax primogenitus]
MLGLLETLSIILAVNAAWGLGSSCSAPMTGCTAAPGDPYWMQLIQHNGTSPYNTDPSTYQVYRNVKDFGAQGDGVTDDTAAINAAIAYGNRCGYGCQSSTTSPALVFFPSGTYLVSAPLLAYYYTEMVGDARSMATLLASPSFSGIAVIDADPYTADGEWYINQDNFYRSVRNIIIDLTQTPPTASSTGIHWQVSQATSLVNVVVNMSTAPDTNHQGIYMEDGSGGFMSDLIFKGGKYGIWVGNQQFTVRNITVNNAQIGIYANWNWGWTFQGVTINNCQVGMEIATGGSSVGGEVIIDAQVYNTPTFIQTTTAQRTTLGGSILLSNIYLSNVTTAVADPEGTVLAGGTTTISQWAQGNVYTGISGEYRYQQAALAAPYKPPTLLDSTGRIYARSRPQYTDYAPNQFQSVKAMGAMGDGVTDDTAAIQKTIDQASVYAGCKIIYFDAGTYYVTNTIRFPADTIIVGEVWSVIMGGGPVSSDAARPVPVVQIGTPGSRGVMEITDIVFSTRGPAPGAIIVEWNVGQTSQGSAGAWDTHVRTGGLDGSNLQYATCSSTNTTATPAECTASFLDVHITSGASAYLENVWLWTADHDLDTYGNGQLNIYTGRGLLSEAVNGPVWLIGTASEHHALYQYNVVNSQNFYGGLMQTETAYWQPNPLAPAPFYVNALYYDPLTYPSGKGWSLYIQNSIDALVYGAGFYSFFNDYDASCEANYTCNAQILNIINSYPVSIYGLATVATTYQLRVDNYPVVAAANDHDGFQNTMTAWTLY